MNTGNSRNSGFRDALESYSSSHPGDVVTFDEEVRIEYETTALATQVSPAISRFRKLSGFNGFSMVSNLLGSEERIQFFTLTNSREEFSERWARSLSRKRGSHPPKVTEEKPGFKDNIMKGENVNLQKIPVPTHYSNDGKKLSHGQYITSGLIISRNPDNRDVINMGFGRIQILGKRLFAFDAGSKGHTWSYLDRYSRMEKPMDFTVIIGTHPVFYLLGAAFIENEYVSAEEFIDVNLSEGIMNDIPVPVDSEIILEARFNPQEKVDEGPFGEYTGYMGYDTTGFTAECLSIMHRNDAVYYDILPSNSSEHISIFSYPRSINIENRIRESLPGGSEIRIEWPPFGSRFMALGYAESKAGDIALQAACGIVSMDPLWGKIVLMYRRKSPLDFEGFLASVAASSKRGFSNLTFLEKSFIISSDAGSSGRMQSSRLLAILDPCRYEMHKKYGITEIAGNGSRVLISHDPTNEADLDILVPEDIDPENISQVGWAISTRVDPERDITIRDQNMTIDARRVKPETPEIPPEYIDSARNMIQRMKGVR